MALPNLSDLSERQKAIDGLQRLMQLTQALGQTGPRPAGNKAVADESLFVHSIFQEMREALNLMEDNCSSRFDFGHLQRRTWRCLSTAWKGLLQVLNSDVAAAAIHAVISSSPNINSRSQSPSRSDSPEVNAMAPARTRSEEEEEEEKKQEPSPYTKLVAVAWIAVGAFFTALGLRKVNDAAELTQHLDTLFKDKVANWATLPGSTKLEHALYELKTHIEGAKACITLYTDDQETDGVTQLIVRNIIRDLKETFEQMNDTTNAMKTLGQRSLNTGRGVILTGVSMITYGITSLFAQTIGPLARLFQLGAVTTGIGASIAGIYYSNAFLFVKSTEMTAVDKMHAKLDALETKWSTAQTKPNFRAIIDVIRTRHNTECHDRSQHQYKVPEPTPLTRQRIAVVA